MKPMASGITPMLKSNGAGTATASNTVSQQIQNTQGGGSPLPDSTKTFMESGFGAGFSDVRIHSGSEAAQLSGELNAQAFTVGKDIYFNSGKYAPGSPEGKHLLAHELTHTLQQGGNRSMGQAKNMLQRKLVITPAVLPPVPGSGKPGVPFTTAAQALLRETCPDGGITVDPKSGVVSTSDTFSHPPLLPDVTEADISSTPVGCKCLCDVINSAQTTTIDFVAGTDPKTRPNVSGGVRKGFTGAGAGDPHVLVDPSFQGQYRINGKWVDIPFFLIFAHEICGHALPFMQGKRVPIGPGPANGVPPHERVSVDVERQIAAEHNPPLPRRPEDYGGDARQKP
jgi:hypothetical protein